MSTQTPTLAEILDLVIHDRLRESFGGWLPARVESYDSGTNTASVQILVYDDYEDEEGERQIEPIPVINDVPVAFLSLGGKFVLRSTVNKGDEGIYMSPARPTSKWLQTGGMVDPEDDGHHTLDGGVFLPYRVSLGGSNGDPMIEITSSEIKAGGSNSLTLASEINDLKSEFYKHSHTANGTSYPAFTLPKNPSEPSDYPGTQKLKGG